MMFRPDKRNKRKKYYKDSKKRKNILIQWQRRQKNRQQAGLPLERMPIDFPKSRKINNK